MKCIDKLIQTNDLEYDEILYLIKNVSLQDLDILRNAAFIVQKRYYKGVYLRGLIEVSNYCKRNCKYCGIRRSQAKAIRYRLKKDEILLACDKAYNLGLRTFVLQGGEDAYFTDEVLVDIINAIKSRYDVAITLSLGEKSYESYKRLKEAGADRYLLRHETADEEHYDFLHEDMSLASRKRCLEDLKSLGFQVGAGFMVGSPRQTDEMLAKDLIFLKEFSPHMLGIGPFISHKDTPFANYESGDVDKTLLMIMLSRLLVPKAMIPATTALATMDRGAMYLALRSGANVVMPNLTPDIYRKNYEIYKNKCSQTHLIDELSNAGFMVDMGKGDYYG